MAFKRFGSRLYIRLGLLLAVLLGIAALVAQSDFVLLPLLLLAVAVGQVLELSRFVNRTNKELARFLFAIQHNDFTATYTDANLGDGFPELAAALRSIADKFRQNRIEKESYLHFLDAVVAEVQVGLLALNSKGEVRIMNQTASQLLDLPNLKLWERFAAKAPDFAEKATQLAVGERTLLPAPKGRMLALSCSSITLLGEKHRIFTFYDLRNELERNELESYNRLISILTHEIMNSVAPVSSLAETMQALVHTENEQIKHASTLTAEDMDDLAQALTTIAGRTSGLLHFVQEYRKVARVPEPALAEESVQEILHRAATLLRPELEQRGIQLEVEVNPPPMRIYLDATQIDQILINLLTNAMQALEDRAEPTIKLYAYVADGGKHIAVSDNGPGVPPDLRENIFVPFFTTRTNGSGIGLSLSQQIMQKHKGALSYQPASTGGATFVLSFRY